MSPTQTAYVAVQVGTEVLVKDHINMTCSNLDFQSKVSRENHISPFQRQSERVSQKWRNTDSLPIYLEMIRFTNLEKK